MIHTISLAPGVTLRCFPDSRFKQGCISFQIIRPMNLQEAAQNALIPSVLLRATRNHPDLRSITHKLDELYGAAVSTIVRRVGDYQTTGLYCSFLDDRFTLSGDEILRPVTEFLMELLLDSPTENGGFLPEIVESEKKNLISTIESQRNDKRVYAMDQLFRLMCREDSFGLSRLGEKEQVAAIQPVALYEHYQEILKQSQIHIFYVGDAKPEQVADILRPMLARMERAPLDLPEQTPFHTCPGEDKVETMEVSQGKLCMGFTSPITNRDPKFAAMQVFNTLYGSGMTSKLFMRIREQLSLCYGIGSGYYGSKGILAVSAGIDFDKVDKTKQEVLALLEDCRQGKISPEELEAGREAVLSTLRATHDSPGSIENYYATAALSGMKMTPAEYMAAVEQVGLSDVVACARSLCLHSTYFLKGATE